MRSYQIPKDVEAKGIYLSRNIIYLTSFLMSMLLIIAHMSNSVPSFVEAISKMAYLLPLSFFVLIPVYFIYWIGLFVFPIGFLIITCKIITDRIRPYRKKYFINKK